MLLLGLVGCTPITSVEQPVVSDSLMVEVLLDLHLVDARARALGNVTPGLRDSVLAHHGLDSVRYEAAVQRLMENPDTYLDLYSQALDRLNDERHQEINR